MVPKQPVMFTAAAIKDKSPTTRSRRGPEGAARAPQTAAWGSGGASARALPPPSLALKTLLPMRTCYIYYN